MPAAAPPQPGLSRSCNNNVEVHVHSPDSQRVWTSERVALPALLALQLCGWLSSLACAALRPRLESLYDVFVNVRDDERAHWGALCALVQYDALEEPEGAEIRSTEAAPPADGRGFKP